MDWDKKRKKIYAAVVLILVIFLIFLSFPAARLFFLRIFRGNGLKTVKPQISAYEELRYLWTFNAYPPIDLAKGENFTLDQSKEGKNKLISSFDFDANLNQAVSFFKNYLSKNDYSEISEEGKDGYFIISATFRGLPIVISVEKKSDSLTKITLVFETRNIIRKPLNK